MQFEGGEATFPAKAFKARYMPIEEEISKGLSKAPYILVALLLALLFTAAGYFFIYFAKALYTLPQSFDLPWILVFILAFFFLLVRKRIKTVHSDNKPALT